MHRTCEFEIWISGYSRKIQCSYYERLRYTECPFEMCANPERNDFIIKTVARKKITTDAPEVIIAEIKRKIVELEEYIKKYQRLETTERWGGGTEGSAEHDFIRWAMEIWLPDIFFASTF